MRSKTEVVELADGTLLVDHAVQLDQPLECIMLKVREVADEPHGGDPEAMAEELARDGDALAARLPEPRPEPRPEERIEPVVGPPAELPQWATASGADLDRLAENMGLHRHIAPPNTFRADGETDAALRARIQAALRVAPTPTEERLRRSVERAVEASTGWRVRVVSVNYAMTTDGDDRVNIELVRER